MKHVCVWRRRDGKEDRREGVELTKDGRPQIRSGTNQRWQATDKEWGQRWQTTVGKQTSIPRLLL